MAVGEDRYNQGVVGSQPNYPTSYNNGLTGDYSSRKEEDYPYDLGFDPEDARRVGEKKPYKDLTRDKSELRAPGGLLGPGTQPVALHTEYIEDGGGDYKAYGNQDVVFYITHCGADSPSGPSPDPSGFSVPPEGGGVGGFSVDLPIDAGGYSGPSGRSGMQSGANQISMGEIARSLGDVTGGPMAPMSGFSYDEEEPLGRWSQNAAFQVNVATAVRNALRTVPGLGSEVTVKGLASSEQMFNRMLLNGFVPNNELHQKRTAEQILETLDRPTTSELAFQLAESTDGLLRYKDVVQKVNEGELGAVTSRSRAIQDRMSTTGKVSKV